MQAKIFNNLSDAIKNNDSRYFYEILNENFNSLDDLATETYFNIYHLIASTQTNEKYLAAFLEQVNNWVQKRFGAKEIENFLNMTDTSEEKQTPLHIAITRGKSVKNI